MTIRDADRFKDKIELSLDSRQIFFLFFGGAVIACLVFVLGVMVGKRLEAREQVGRRASTSAAVDPLAALDELAADEKRDGDFAFGAALGEPGGRQRPLGNADLSPAGRPGADKSPPAAPADVKADGKGDAKADAKDVQEKPAPPKQAQADAKADGKTDAKADGKADAKSDAKGDAKGIKGKFTLQLSAFQDKAEAEAFVQRLKASGYSPRVSETDVPERGTFYRVRVGEYADHDQALEAKREFEKREHIIAYVSRL